MSFIKAYTGIQLIDLLLKYSSIYLLNQFSNKLFNLHCNKGEKTNDFNHYKPWSQSCKKVKKKKTSNWNRFRIFVK